MNMQKANHCREIWVDNVKIFACILVVLGHFFQSMTKSGIMEESAAWMYFNQTIYAFHVPLFFICSGYLYQKFSVVRDSGAWLNNMKKKALVLGVPFVTFSVASWVLKNVFSGAVNEEADGIVKVLLIEPSAPYWFLYVLFLLFLITPTMSGRKEGYIGLGIAVLMKLVSLYVPLRIYAVNRIFGSEIWFVLGMMLCLFELPRFAQKKICLWTGSGCMLLFVGGSICLRDPSTAFWPEQKNLLVGLVACAAVVLLVAWLFRENRQPRVLGLFAKYTMPIFLMHTIFAAAFRSVLMKIGVASAPVHIVTGLLVSFACPIAAAMIMERFWVLNFFLYPDKVLKRLKNKT